MNLWRCLFKRSGQNFLLYKQNNNKTVKNFCHFVWISNALTSLCFSKYFFLPMGLFLSAHLCSRENSVRSYLDNIWMTLVQLRSFCSNASLSWYISSTCRIWWALSLLESTHKWIPKCNNGHSIPFWLHQCKSTSASPNNCIYTHQATYSFHIILDWIFALWYPSNFD